jgi:cell wall-associated NlpC family hydrolase
LKKFIHISLRIFLGISFFLFTVGCSASSSKKRYNKNNEAHEDKPQLRYPSNDTAESTSANKPDIQVYNDLPDTLDEFDETPSEEKPVDKSNFVKSIEKLESSSVAISPREKVLLEVIKYLDTPYKYGGSSGKGIDCSAFTMAVFKNSLELKLPRSSREQYQIGEEISVDDLKFGDLVFFNTRRRSKPGHVGIFIGENQFVHASRKLGVTVSSLDDAYYKKRYMGARRIESIQQ